LEVPSIPPEKSPWDSPYVRSGIAVTVLWLAGGIATMMFFSDRPSWPKPNEWGDIFAGLFAPVAFFWLVLGYLQQGKELQLNTRALQLQVAELQASVEQQRALVEVSRQQVVATLKEYDRALAQEAAAALPRFVMRISGRERAAGDRMSYEFTLSNEGETATNVVITIWPAPPIGHESRFASMRIRSDKAFPAAFEDDLTEGTIFNVAYTDVRSVERSHRFVAVRNSEGVGPYPMRIEDEPSPI